MDRKWGKQGKTRICKGELKSTTVDRNVSMSVSGHLHTQNTDDRGDLYERLMPFEPELHMHLTKVSVRLKKEDWQSWKTFSPGCCPAPTK